MTQFFFKSLIIFMLFQTFLFAQTINIDEEIHNSIGSGKPVVIFLHRVGCSYCNSMEEFTLESDEVKEFIESNFKLLSINVTSDKQVIYKGKEVTGLDFAIKIGYNFYPSTLFLNTQESLDYTSVGYKNEYDFLVLLKFMKSGSFKNMQLEQYEKSIGYIKNNEDEIVDERKHER